jgi:23S rRNA pseudouridine2605 synthase
VTVNGHLLEDPETPVDPGRDRLEVDGRLLCELPRLHLAMNKPRGVLTAVRDPAGRRTVRDLLASEHARAKPVGRLDRDSSGLLLLTTDGDLHFAITGPRSAVRKTYRVVVNGVVEDARFDPLRAGAWLDGERLAPMAVRIVAASPRTTELEMVLTEGRFRQIRRTLHGISLRVLSLDRIAIGPLRLGDLARGASRELAPSEVDDLRAAARLPRLSSRPPGPPDREGPD